MVWQALSASATVSIVNLAVYLILSQLSGCAETCQTQCWAFGMCPRAQFSANRTCGVYIAVFETMKHLIYAMFLL